MKKNMTNLLLNSVQEVNKDTRSLIKESILSEEVYDLDPRFDRANSFYGKAKIDENGDEITLISYGTPIVKVSNGNFEFLCDERALTQTTMRHIRDFLKQMDYEGKIDLSGKDYPITTKWVRDHLNNKIEESLENNIEEKEERIEVVKDELKDGALDDPNYVKDLSDDELEDLAKEYVEDEETLTEAEETEEIKDVEETDIVDDITDDEMTDEEVKDEIKDDMEDIIKDDEELPFYATSENFDELRDVLVELDYKLLLVNDKYVIIGRLNGPTLEVLVNNKNGEEDNYEFIEAPNTLDNLINYCNVFYLSPDLDDEEYKAFENKLADQDSVMTYLMNELPEKVKKELEDNKAKEEITTPEETYDNIEVDAEEMNSSEDFNNEEEE